MTQMPEQIALAHADGKLPNLALMRLATYFRGRGADVHLVRTGMRRMNLFGERPRVFGSSIFSFSSGARRLLDAEWGPIQWGGTGVNVASSLAEIDPAANWDAMEPDYSLYPWFPFSIGFSQRGCRLRCGFCVVPKKEGAPRATGTIASIWRREPHPKKIVLLDNDFFGTPTWRERVREIRDGGFRVSFSQGINIRLVDDEAAEALATIQYRDNEFRERVLYTAWDNLGDEEVFRRAVARLERAGVPAKHLRVYMLVGYRPSETFADIMHRFNALRELGCEPYPMVFDNARRPPGLPPDRTLKHFQRWALRLARSGAIRFEDYDPHFKATRTAEALTHEQ